MTTPKKASGVDEKMHQLEGAVHDVLEGAKESIARAEGSMEKPKKHWRGVRKDPVGVHPMPTAEAKVDTLTEAWARLENAREKTGELYGRSRELAEEATRRPKRTFEDEDQRRRQERLCQGQGEGVRSDVRRFVTTWWTTSGAPRQVGPDRLGIGFAVATSCAVGSHDEWTTRNPVTRSRATTSRSRRRSRTSSRTMRTSGGPPRA